uniref:Trafficking protein particle complex subunit 13 n=1 Tax=Parastrongyloides trichosuri TaxID=131310 RepID=A0A0N5A0D8_PARTI
MMSPILNLTGVNSQNGGSSLFRGSSGSSGSGGGSGNRRRRNVINELPPVSDMSNTPCSSGGCCGVMRLARPKLNDGLTLPLDPCDDISNNIKKSLKHITGQENLDLPIGSYLMVPQTFDSIYLGETFNCYVCISNHSSQTCVEICSKVQLQTNTQNFLLNSKLTDANAELHANEQLGQVISYEVKETGQHILVCEVNYKTQNGERMYFRKHFKYLVNKPIDVKTRFYNAEDNLNNDVYFEAQVQNTCSNPIVLEKVVLDPSEFYQSYEIKSAIKTISNFPSISDSFNNFNIASRESSPTTGSKMETDNVYLLPREVRQYLYCLTPKMHKHSMHQYRGVTTIGKLDMAWRSHMGERGRLQTGQLQRMAPGYGDVRLIIESIPTTIKLHVPFEIVCRLYNFCERNLDLVYDVVNLPQAGLEFCCLNGVHLGQISQNKTVDFKLTVLPVLPGFQYLSGIRVTDGFLNRVYEFDEISNVFVNE